MEKLVFVFVMVFCAILAARFYRLVRQARHVNRFLEELAFFGIDPKDMRERIRRDHQSAKEFIYKKMLEWQYLWHHRCRRAFTELAGSDAFQRFSHELQEDIHAATKRISESLEAAPNAGIGIGEEIFIDITEEENPRDPAVEKFWQDIAELVGELQRVKDIQRHWEEFGRA